MNTTDDFMAGIYQAILRQAERTRWHLTREAHQRRLNAARNQRDHRPKNNRQLQRGRNSWHGDRGKRT